MAGVRWSSILPLLALALAGPVLGASNWADVVEYVVKLPAPANYNPETSTVFSRDLTSFQTLVSNGGATGKTADFVNAVHALRRAYRAAPGAPDHDPNNLNAPDTRPQLVVVGGGPNGLAAALLLAKDGTHRITVLEKTNGQDPRWNGILLEANMKTLFGADLGVDNTWVGQLSEMEYVLGAALLAVGVDVKYNTLFTQICSSAADTVHHVHYRTTPGKTSPDRHKAWEKVDICNGADANLPGQGSVQVAAVIGADGTHSAVRRIIGGTFDEVETVVPRLTDKHEQAVTVDPATTIRLHKPNALTDALLTHVIVSMRAPLSSSFDALEKAVISASNVPRATAPVSNKEISRMLINNHELNQLANKQRKKAEEKMADIVPWDIVASGIAHRRKYVNPDGTPGERVYIELLLRHQSSKVFQEKYHTVLGDMDRLLYAANEGEFSHLHPADRPKAFAGAEAALVESLLQNIYEFVNPVNPIAPNGARMLDGVFPSKHSLLTHVDKIKIYDQRLRQASQVAQLTPTLKVVVVGDATRDAYYAFGNSVNSAYQAFYDHRAALLAPGSGAQAAAAYKAQAVSEFVSFIATDIYLRTFCGCVPAQANFQRLAFKRARCIVADSPKFVKGGKTGLKAIGQVSATCPWVSIHSLALDDNMTKSQKQVCEANSWGDFLKVISPICDDY